MMRRRFTSALVCVLSLLLGCDASDHLNTTGNLPKLTPKSSYRLGFAQIETNIPWRIAQTESMKQEAAKRGHQLICTYASGSEAKQISDVDSLIAQGVDAIFIPPRSEKPLARAVLKAKRAGIPVILLDRGVDTTLAKPGRDYVTFIGSDFVEEGRMAAEWLIKSTDAQAKIIQLEGTVGSTPAIDRQRGFEETIAKHAGMQIIASQSADFARDKARKVMETLLQAHPEVTAIYAHGDDMAIGAIAALESSGRQPGIDVLVVGVDGSRVALEAVVAGKLGATIECNPRFGPKAFDVLEAYANGLPIPPKIINPDRIFDSTNAAEGLKTAF